MVRLKTFVSKALRRFLGCFRRVFKHLKIDNLSTGSVEVSGSIPLSSTNNIKYLCFTISDRNLKC